MYMANFNFFFSFDPTRFICIMVPGFEIAIVYPFEGRGSLLHKASALREILKHSTCMSVSCMIGSTKISNGPCPALLSDLNCNINCKGAKKYREVVKLFKSHENHVIPELTLLTGPSFSQLD